MTTRIHNMLIHVKHNDTHITSSREIKDVLYVLHIKLP